MPPDPKLVAQLVEKLDSKSFAIRKKAKAALERLGSQAEAALVKALGSNPSDEKRQHIKRLLEKAPSATDWVRTLRMFELLEHIGAPEARQLLKTLAANKSDPSFAAEVRAAERRLRQRNAAKP